MQTIDPTDHADLAGLRYVSDEELGISRVRRGRGFSYHHPDGTLVDDATRERIEQLAIPPAWGEVWICRDPHGHLLATGRDRRGRKQYLYHPDWRAVRDEAKFDRMAPFGDSLGTLRKTVDADLRRHGLPRERVLALVVRLMDETLIRIGNRRYSEENGTYGLTTLRPEHVDAGTSTIEFRFDGKNGKQRELAVRSRRLATIVRRCEDLGGHELFAYEDDRGAVVDVDSSDVNAYLRETTGEPFTAKDFRTWGASTAVVGALGPVTPGGDAATQVIEAIDVAASRLDNTRAVCRTSYVHPLVCDAFEDGILHVLWSRSRTGTLLDRSEQTFVKLLDAAA